MQGDWLTIHESEAPRSNDIIIERVHYKITSSSGPNKYFHKTAQLYTYVNLSISTWELKSLGHPSLS